MTPNPSLPAIATRLPPRPNPRRSALPAALLALAAIAPSAGAARDVPTAQDEAMSVSATRSLADDPFTHDPSFGYGEGWLRAANKTTLNT